MECIDIILLTSLPADFSTLQRWYIRPQIMKHPYYENQLLRKLCLKFDVCIRLDRNCLCINFLQNHFHDLKMVSLNSASNFLSEIAKIQKSVFLVVTHVSLFVITYASHVTSMYHAMYFYHLDTCSYYFKTFAEISVIMHFRTKKIDISVPAVNVFKTPNMERGKGATFPKKQMVFSAFLKFLSSRCTQQWWDFSIA